MYTIHLSYHLECLTPPLDDIPEGDWYCSRCEAIMMSQYISSFEDGSPVITSEDTCSVSLCSSDDEDQQVLSIILRAEADGAKRTMSSA